MRSFHHKKNTRISKLIDIRVFLTNYGLLRSGAETATALNAFLNKLVLA